nr:putative retrotransposon Ty1-copia subclass protein [Tanacetum cinerariifolium]
MLYDVCGDLDTLAENLDKLNYLEHPIPPAPIVPAGQHVDPEILAAHTAWIKGSKEIVGLMLMTMKPDIQRKLKTLHAHEMLLELKTLFAQQADLEKTINELHAMLKLHEKTLPKNNAPALHAIRAGHWKRNCPQYLVELLKKKKNAASGAGGSGLKESRKLKPRALSLYVGNGQREAVEAIGVFYLCLPSGLEIVLNNCHYAPSITRGVIFVSRLAKLDLDSALLWHCRLGHISKKRIEKLQHQVERCVSCMSGKMARKPYTHQVERAKDLLGLIHTDVCGLFKIMSRQGASYLVTFTDDFSPSGSLKDLEIIQEEDTHLSIDTSLNHKENDLEIDKPQSEIVPIRRSTRTRHAPDRMCLYIDAEEHELGDLGEPANYKAALLDPKSEKWLNVMNVEMQSMKDNEVWVLVELPPNGKTISSKWIFKKKTDMNGVLYTYKARLVAKGYTQTLGIDYEETFSLVVDIRAIRILIAIATYNDYEIWQMNVKTAFLNGCQNCLP